MTKDRVEFVLRSHELAGAMSFGANSELSGSREGMMKQIGNAVPIRTARSFCRELPAA